MWKVMGEVRFTELRQRLKWKTCFIKGPSFSGKRNIAIAILNLEITKFILIQLIWMKTLFSVESTTAHFLPFLDSTIAFLSVREMYLKLLQYFFSKKICWSFTPCTEKNDTRRSYLFLFLSVTQWHSSVVLGKEWKEWSSFN